MSPWLLQRGKSRLQRSSSQVTRAEHRGHKLPALESLEHVFDLHLSAFREQTSRACPRALQTRSPGRQAHSQHRNVAVTVLCLTQTKLPKENTTACFQNHAQMCPHPQRARVPGVGHQGHTQLSDASTCKPSPAWNPAHKHFL